MRKLKPSTALCASITCLWLAACAVQPARVQSGAIPQAFPPTAKEDAYGRRIFTSLSEDHPIDVGSANHDQLNGVFNHLAESVTLNPNDWQVFLLDAPGIADVRAVQGNYIFVWSGVFDVIEDESELAGLLACEMAHELAGHTEPVVFNVASELLFAITDVITTFGVAVLTQGIVNISGTGMTRWAYVEAADLDPVDRIYDEAQVEDMAAIALLILNASSYFPDALLGFWERAASNNALENKVARLSRDISPQKWVEIFQAAMRRVPDRRSPEEDSAVVTEQTVEFGQESSIWANSP